MAVLRTVICAVLMVTSATSKPIHISEGDDSAMSSESSESNSSEEAAAHVEAVPDPLQPPSLTETDLQDPAVPLPSAESEPSPSTLNTSNPDDPQTSADALYLVPVDPSQTALGIKISSVLPPVITTDAVPILLHTEVSPHSGLTETDITKGTCGTNPIQTTSTHQESPEGATSTFPPHIINPKSPFSTAAPMPVPISTTLTGVPVCFTFQFTTSEPDPPRGDSI